MNLGEAREEAMKMLAYFLDQIGIDGEYYSQMKKTPIMWGLPTWNAMGEYLLPNNEKINRLLQTGNSDKKLRNKCESDGLIVINRNFRELDKPTKEVYETLIHESIHAGRAILLHDVFRDDKDNSLAYTTNNGILEQNKHRMSSKYADPSQHVLKGSIDTSDETIEKYASIPSGKLEEISSYDSKIIRKMSRQHFTDEALVDLMAQLSYMMYSSKEQGKVIDVWEAMEKVKKSNITSEQSKNDNLQKSVKEMCSIVLRHHDLELFNWMIDPIGYSNGDMHYDFFDEYTKKDKDLLYELYNDQKMKRIEKKYKPYKASNDSKNDNEER